MKRELNILCSFLRINHKYLWFERKEILFRHLSKYITNFCDLNEKKSPCLPGINFNAFVKGDLLTNWCDQSIHFYLSLCKKQNINHMKMLSKNLSLLLQNMSIFTMSYRIQKNCISYIMFSIERRRIVVVMLTFQFSLT